jgi:putative ABC transport system permease protein
MHTVLQDLRFGVRTLSKNARFTVVAVVALALGIGAVSTIFSIVYGVLYSPLPFPDADRLAMVYMRFSPQNAERGPLSVADFLDWRARNRAFEPPAALAGSEFDLTGFGEPEQVTGARVTADFFSVLGVKPLLGRFFQPGEDSASSHDAVVLSDALWRRRFAASPNAVGRSIMLNGAQATIIGVAPSTFRFPLPTTDLWTNLQLVPPTRRGPFFMRGVARLKPGITFAQAQGEMNILGRRIESENPDAYRGLTLPVVPMRDALVGDVRPALLATLGAVVFLLLIAVLNVATLLLARATVREREMAVRLSIGATAGRLLQQLLTESVLLALLGGTLGVGIAWGGITVFRAWNPGNLPRIEKVTVDIRVLAFTSIISIVCGIAFGLAPGFQSSRTDLNSILREGGQTGTAGYRKRRVCAELVVAEIALSLVLLIGAGLLLRTFVSLQHVKPGFQAPPQSVLTVQISPGVNRYADDLAVVRFYRMLADDVRLLPGIKSADLTDTLPPDRQGDSDTFQIEGEAFGAGDVYPAVTVAQIGPDYFRAIGIPLARGRYFSERDSPDSPRVTIISESFARRFFEGADPIGKRIKQSGRNLSKLPYMEIVGVVADAKYEGMDRESDAAYYLPYTQSPALRMYLVVRSELPPETLVTSLREVVRKLDPDAVVTQVSTMQQAMSESLARPRFRAALLALFAGVALALAAVGVYGVISYAVAQRTREFGVRMAVGARRIDLMTLVIRDGTIMAAIAILISIPCALAVTRTLSSLLFGVSASDPLTFIAASLILTLVALLATVIPALRVTRIDPLTALRGE